MPLALCMGGHWNNKRVVLATFTAVLIVATACAPQMRIYPAVDRFMARADFASAMELVEKNKGGYGKRDYLIYLMDQAILAHYAGDYVQSAKIFGEADQEFEERYTESITRYVATWLVNDLAAGYRGEDFEGVMINLFNAMNYAMLGQRAEALVEARRVDNRLNLINSKYDEDKKNVYKEDGFARFLMGILYEDGGTSQDLNDAYIFYKKAYKTYKDDFSLNYGTPPPPALKENLLSVAAFMGTEEWSHWKRSFPGVKFITLDQRSKQAEVYVIHYNGQAPVKAEESITIPVPGRRIVRIAFPGYQERPRNICSSVISAFGPRRKPVCRSRSVLAEHIGRIAMKNLENRKARVKAKAIARATTKFVIGKAASDEIRKEQGGMAGLIADILTTVVAGVTEQADLRCWRTLPAEIRVAKLMVKPGEYRITAECLGQSDGVARRLGLGRYTLEAGDKRFIIFHTFD
jgi:hypothetical protein